MLPEPNYDDLSPQELADEIKGLDREIETCQNSLAKLQKELRHKKELQENLLDLVSYKRQAARGRHK